MRMGIDKSASDRKGRSSEAKKQRNRRRRLHPVQNLYDTCKEVFADCRPDVVPSPENVERVKAILDTMSGTDVGLWPSQTYFKSTGNDKPPRITYMGIHECNKLSIGIFCLPPSGVIPLHNHPGMTVFSKILFGKMHIQSYDWVDGDTNADKSCNPSGVRLAKTKVNSDFTAPCKSSILYPNDCNMHCFRALTACAVLDVLVPPYNGLEGRHCQYYSDFPFSNASVEGEGEEGVARSVPEVPDEGPEKRYVWLKERAMPENLRVVGALYKGPKLAR